MLIATGLLLALALASIRFATAPNSPIVIHLLIAFATAGACVVIRQIVLPRIAEKASQPRQRIGKALVSTVVFVGALASIALTMALANEELVLAALFSLAAAVFAGASDATSLKRAAFASGAVILFTLPGMDSELRTAVIAAGIVLGAAWFIASTLSANSAARDRWSWLYGTAIICGLALVCVISHLAIRPTDGNPWYAAWLPTSGGDQAGSENARRGTGEGPDEISGDSPDSIGFDKSDTFAESGRDGLYDLWIESYGEPVKSAEQQKMVGLKPNDARIANAGDQENLKVGRTFESHRSTKRASAPATRPDVRADAMVWVKGHLPVYLPLTVFDDFDGAAWHAVAPGKSIVPVRRLSESSWMEVLHRPISPAFSGTSQYDIRVGNLGGDILPMPPIVERFKMGRVNRPDFFSSTRSGLIRLASRTVPAGATMSVVCKDVSPSRLVGVEPALPKNTDSAVLATDQVDEQVRHLARAWGAGRERGWLQIEQVILRLREHVRFDRSAVVHPSKHPINDLLFADRVGSDHQIAGAAVMLLRSLGYPTRLVSGLYADEANLDSRSGFAALGADEVRFWIEVRLADGTWITVDPTPGYPMLNLPKPFGEWLSGVWKRTTHELRIHAPMLIAAAAAAAGLYAARRHVMNGIVTAWCVTLGCDLRRALKVIELRSRLSNRARDHSVPVARWICSLSSSPAIDRFAHELNRELYHSHEESRAETSRQVAREALRELTIRKLRSEQPSDAL